MAVAMLDEIERPVSLALACVGREFPYHVAYLVRGPDDVRRPRDLTPAFWGCYDWHSAVHGHWTLARGLRVCPDAPFAPAARAALGRALTPERIAGELAFAQPRPSFERPYGLAWLLMLDAEVRALAAVEPAGWAAALRPLAALAADRLRGWLPKLSHPVRVGTHAQTAFSLGLVLDAAERTGDTSLAELARARAVDWFGRDRDLPLALEPNGEDFLSPSLAAADVLRRVLSPAAFAAWLSAALPGIAEDGATGWLAPVTPSDRADGRIVHLDGLSLSRAWMLEAIAGALPEGDRRIASLRETSGLHARAGLEAVTGERYEGGHWLGTFAMYLVTRAWRHVAGADPPGVARVP